MERYYGILSGDRNARYLETKETAACFGPDDDEQTLWSAHSASMNRTRSAPRGRSLMSLKNEIGKKMMARCSLCEHRCAADRLAGDTGKCRVLEARVSSEFLHTGRNQT